MPTWRKPPWPPSRGCPAMKWTPTFLTRLPAATGKNRQVLILLVGQRHIDRALPVVVSSANDADAGVRTAAIQTIGILGTDAQAADLVKLLQGTKDSKERADIEMALLAISGRTGATFRAGLAPARPER